MESQLQNEILFYQDLQVMVTQSRYIANSKTYAMRNISSVHLFEIVKSRTIPILMIVVGLLIFVIGDGKIIGGLILLLGVLFLALTKNEYAVRISTNSGESNSIVSNDKNYVQQIVNALNEAIINRG